MKNTYQESLRKQAKMYHRNERGSVFTNGLLIKHSYESASKTNLSWWGDVDFILNNYRVSVEWIHPRQDYLDHVEGEVHKSLEHLNIDLLDGIVTSTTYRKLGKSRKKVLLRKVDYSKELGDYNEAYEAAFEKISRSSEYKARPHIRTNWEKDSYAVSVCMPVEILAVDDLVQLVYLVKKLIKRETTLDAEFKDYVYANQQFVKEEIFKEIKNFCIDYKII